MQAVLHRLLDHAEQFEAVLSAASELPNLIAIATDLFDAFVKQASEQGIDIEARAKDLLSLFQQLTAPENAAALRVLVDQLPHLATAANHLNELPNLAAIATDVFDEWSSQLKADGIQLEESVRNGLYAALYLGGQIHRDELDRLGFLLKSEVLSEHSVATVGMAGAALSNCHEQVCHSPIPKQIGLFGLLKAMRNPQTKRALVFAVQFSKCFGGMLEDMEKSQSADPR